MEQKKNIVYVTTASAIATLYVALTYVSGGLASGPVQLRLSEALCVLPVVTKAAVPGLTVGCLLYNLIFSGNILDIIFGTLATLIGALFATLFKKHKYLAFLPTFISNTLIVPFVIAFGFTSDGLSSIPFFMLTVGIGEFISSGILGNLIILYFSKHKF